MSAHLSQPIRLTEAHIDCTHYGAVDGQKCTRRLSRIANEHKIERLETATTHCVLPRLEMRQLVPYLGETEDKDQI